MFFMFYILVIPIYLSVINSHSVEDKYVLDRFKGYRESYGIEDSTINMSSIFPTHRPMVQIIQNLTKVKRTNLKSNVFDKMLAGEMFSIKQRFHDKDMTHISPSPKLVRTKAKKPTLEIRQKWPVIKVLERSNMDKTNDIEMRSLEDTKVESNKTNSKLGIRSLSGNLRHMQDIFDMPPNSDYSDFLSHSEPEKMCKFFKTSTLCSGHESTTQKFCSHSKKSRAQSAATLSYLPIYMPFGVPTPNPFVNAYYQDTSHDWKYPKQEELYYEDIASAEDTDEDKLYREYYYDKIKKKHKHGKTKVVVNIQYAQKTGGPEARLKKFPNSIEDDLNKLYGDSFMKKCYCSSGLRTLDAAVLYFYSLIFILLNYS